VILLLAGHRLPDQAQKPDLQTGVPTRKSQHHNPHQGQERDTAGQFAPAGAVYDGLVQAIQPAVSTAVLEVARRSVSLISFISTVNGA
jgi:hypothetical protein